MSKQQHMHFYSTSVRATAVKISTAVLISVLIAPAVATATSQPNPSTVSTQTTTLAVMNIARAPVAAIALAERAVARQVNNSAFQRAWRTPTIRFVNRAARPGEWSVYLTTPKGAAAWCNDATACHSVTYSDSTGLGAGSGTATPTLIVTREAHWSVALSHETIETLADPQGDRALFGLLAEPCDPVEDWTYRIAGTPVSNWVYPSWFRHNSRGPWDSMGALGGSREVNGGYTSTY